MTLTSDFHGTLYSEQTTVHVHVHPHVHVQCIYTFIIHVHVRYAYIFNKTFLSLKTCMSTGLVYTLFIYMYGC